MTQDDQDIQDSALSADQPANVEEFAPDVFVVPEEKPKKSKRPIFGFLLLLAGGGAAGAGTLLIPKGVEQDHIISADAAEINPDDEGKLVHTTGKLTYLPPQDDLFLVTATGPSLKRVVEMYQWVQENGVFVRKWESKPAEIPVESQNIGYVNPKEIPIEPQDWVSTDFKVGNFGLSPSLTESLTSSLEEKPITITPEDLQKLDENGQKAFKIHEGNLYFGEDASQPQIGDMRIRFISKTAPETASILARQSGNGFSAFDNEGQRIEDGLPGDHALAEMSSGITLRSNKMLIQIAQASGGFFAVLGFLFMLSGRSGSKKPKKEKPVKVKKEKPKKEKPQKEPKKDKKAKAAELAAATAALATAAEESFATPADEEYPTAPIMPETDSYAPMDDAITIPETESSFQHNEPAHHTPTEHVPAPAAQDLSDLPEGIEVISDEAMPEAPSTAATDPYSHLADLPELPTQRSGLDFQSAAAEELPEGVEMIAEDLPTTHTPPKKEGLTFELAPATEPIVDANDMDSDVPPPLPLPTYDEMDPSLVPEGVEIVTEESAFDEDAATENNDIPPPPVFDELPEETTEEEATTWQEDDMPPAPPVYDIPADEAEEPLPVPDIQEPEEPATWQEDDLPPAPPVYDIPAEETTEEPVEETLPMPEFLEPETVPVTSSRPTYYEEDTDQGNDIPDVPEETVPVGVPHFTDAQLEALLEPVEYENDDSLLPSIPMDINEGLDLPPLPDELPEPEAMADEDSGDDVVLPPLPDMPSSIPTTPEVIETDLEEIETDHDDVSPFDDIDEEIK